MTAELEPIEVGQTWRHKRESWRRLVVTDVGDEYIDVRRNTSARTQAVKVTTLRRSYYRCAS